MNKWHSCKAIRKNGRSAPSAAALAAVRVAGASALLGLAPVMAGKLVSDSLLWGFCREPQHGNTLRRSSNGASASHLSQGSETLLSAQNLLHLSSPHIQLFSQVTFYAMSNILLYSTSIFVDLWDGSSKNKVNNVRIQAWGYGTTFFSFEIHCLFIYLFI